MVAIERLTRAHRQARPSFTSTLLFKNSEYNSASPTASIPRNSVYDATTDDPVIILCGSAWKVGKERPKQTWDARGARDEEESCVSCLKADGAMSVFPNKEI
ncbi:hypothetical protein VTO73DRAFT_4378 [Trametes versicolor]